MRDALKWYLALISVGENQMFFWEFWPLLHFHERIGSSTKSYSGETPIWVSSPLYLDLPCHFRVNCSLSRDCLTLQFNCIDLPVPAGLYIFFYFYCYQLSWLPIQKIKNQKKSKKSNKKPPVHLKIKTTSKWQNWIKFSGCWFRSAIGTQHFWVSNSVKQGKAKTNSCPWSCTLFFYLRIG